MLLDGTQPGVVQVGDVARGVAPPAVVCNNGQYLGAFGAEFCGIGSKVLFPANRSSNARQVCPRLKDAALWLRGQGSARTAQRNRQVAQHGTEGRRHRHRFDAHYELGLAVNLQRHSRAGKNRAVGPAHVAAVVESPSCGVFRFCLMQSVGGCPQDDAPTLAQEGLKRNQRRPIGSVVFVQAFVQKGLRQHKQSGSGICLGRRKRGPLPRLIQVGSLELLGVGIHVGLHHQCAHAARRRLGVQPSPQSVARHQGDSEHGH